MRRIALAFMAVVLLAGCAWARPRFDGANSGYNPVEGAISRENVGTLQEAFRVSSPGLDTPPTFVVARGHLYVEGASSLVFDGAGGSGCSGSPKTCPPQWTIPQHQYPDVIDSTLYLYGAYDADGIQGCTGPPKVCDALWLDVPSGSPTGATDPAKLRFLLGGTSGHGAELLSLYGYPVQKPPSCTAPAGTLPSCPPVWGHYLGGGSPGGVVGMPAVADGRVFASYSAVSGPQGLLHAFDGRDATGPELWSALLPGVGGPAIAVSGGVVVTTAQTPDGSVLAAYDAAGVKNCSGSPKTCAPLWVSDVWGGAGFDAAPAIANGIVYRAVGSQLRAYDLNGVTGCAGQPVVCQKLWVGVVGDGATAPAVANGLVYTSAADGSVEAFDARGIDSCSATTRACAALWDTNVGSAAGPVEVSGGRVYVATAAGTVRVFSPS